MPWPARPLRRQWPMSSTTWPTAAAAAGGDLAATLGALRRLTEVLTAAQASAAEPPTQPFPPGA
eukprot:3649811-Lingulodinium_polyedra.AAC.1